MLQSDQTKGANPQPLAQQVEACTADDEADAPDKSALRPGKQSRTPT